MISHIEAMEITLKRLHEKETGEEIGNFVIASADNLARLLCYPLYKQIEEGSLRAGDLLLYYSAFELSRLAMLDFMQTKCPEGFSDAAINSFEQDILKYSEEAGFLKSFKEANRKGEHEDDNHEGTASEGSQQPVR